VLVIPVKETLFYVEPIYLKAETAAYPELRLVAVMHDDRLSYAPGFEQALARLIGGEEPIEAAGPAGPRATAPGTAAADARKAFEDYLRFMGEGRFEEASRALEDLGEALSAISTPKTAERRK